MSAKELKLGWTVSETIGVAIVNPRGVTGMKAIPKFYFHNEKGAIDIRQYSIEITGATEAAAKAFAEGILSRKIENSNYDSWKYCGVIDVVYRNGHYTLSLTDNGRGLVEPDCWALLKKDVEKICNNLKAFL